MADMPSTSSPSRPSTPGRISVRGARAHNLKSVNLDIPYYKITAFCGLSGSGKSSMALDVLYAEGQRRYVECFSPSVRARLEKLEKPDVDSIQGLPPAIAVDSQDALRPGRATLASFSELYDCLRTLWSKIGVPHCPNCGRKTPAQSPEAVAQILTAAAGDGLRALICFEPPASSFQKRSQADFEQEWREKGFSRALVGGETFDLNDPKGIPIETLRHAAFLTISATDNADATPQSGVHRDSSGASGDDWTEVGDDSDGALVSGTLMLDPDGDYRAARMSQEKRFHSIQRAAPPMIMLNVDRAILGRTAPERVAEAVGISYEQGGGLCWVLAEKKESCASAEALRELGGADFNLDGKVWTLIAFSRRPRCGFCGVDFPETTPNLFNYSSPTGACELCGGVGTLAALDEDLIIPDKTRPILHGAIAPWGDIKEKKGRADSDASSEAPADETATATSREDVGVKLGKKSKINPHLQDFLNRAEDLGVRVDFPFSSLSRAEREALFNGSRRLGYSGLNGFFTDLLKEKYKMHIRAFLARYERPLQCFQCGGARLRQEALAVTVGGLNIRDLMSQTVDRALETVRGFELTSREQAIAAIPLKQITQRLEYLQKTGLGYLTLDRPLRTLSGGELRRAALARTLGSDLVDMLFVLDEPTSGLHPADSERLASVVRDLRDRRNTVVVVDHNPELLAAADRIVEFGPEAGARGGRIVFEGTPAELLENADSVTGGYLSGRRRGGQPRRREIVETKAIELAGARGRNLKNIDAFFPLGTLCAVTGVSGAGKSTLIMDTLYPALSGHVSADPIPGERPLPYQSLIGCELIDETALINRAPISRSPRSNPVAFMKIFDDIRAVYAEEPEAKARGYSAGFFSFNVKGGRCELCKGEGYIQTDMQFMADAYARCPMCGGKRYGAQALEILHRGRSIADALEMTAQEAFVFFRGFPKIQKRIRRLIDVGLGYVQLGQPANTLSGGESQRLKLASRLAYPRKGSCLYILDEPASGLHFADVVRLIDCLGELVDSGNSVIVIDHSPLLIRAADYVVDLGPGAGELGGEIVAEGTPREIAKNPRSVTGKYLAPFLDSDHENPEKDGSLDAKGQK